VKAQAYFVHIPKTAGNSVRDALRREKLLSNRGYDKKERDHHFGVKFSSRAGSSQQHTENPYFPCYLDTEEYKSSISFTVIRNPFDLLVSYYCHNPQPKDLGWANSRNYHGFKTFEQFIKFYCTEPPAKWHVPHLSKNLFGQIFDEEGILRVDYAIYYENLNAGLRELKGILRPGSNKKIRILNKLNRSKLRAKKPYQEFYDKETRKLVEEKCSWELDTFGYAFNCSNAQTLINLNKHITAEETSK
tara:strand:+ start:1202 stop:1939 length:738 start_codon:yes stop_codon:yes gene_type:complete